MNNIVRILFLIFISATIACSGAKEVANTNNNNASSNSKYPSWYGGFAFSSDSTSFSARATAVADTEEKAQLRAEKEARVLLESYIAKELENIRAELERDGSSVVQKPDFILQLRNAHYKVEEEASVKNSESVKNENIVRGFVKVDITKQKVRSLIENGLSSNKAYQREFVNSQSFKELVAG